MPRLNDDLTADADIAQATRVPLLANLQLSTRGFMLFGAGFLLKEDETHTLRSDRRNARVVRQFRNGKDLTDRPRHVWVIDFALMDEVEARKFPVLFDIIRARVKPERDANSRASRVKFWWRFGEPNPNLRTILDGLNRFIVTVETSKHRFFSFVDAEIAPDNKLLCIAVSDAHCLGVLSSAIHSVWALAAGSMLEDKPVYAKQNCFDPFPFPDPTPALRTRIAAVAESLDAHRKAAIDRDERVTMTGMYNVIAKLRSNEPLTPKERAIHEIAACGVLRDMHDELDNLVADAYGWPHNLTAAEILDRLVALHDVRVAEEAQGIVRWLRPEFQAPNAAVHVAPAELALTPGVSAAVAAVAPVAWPSEAVEQIGALKRLVSAGTVSVDDAVRHFQGAKRDIVARHLETLEILGEVRVVGGGRFAGVGAG